MTRLTREHLLGYLLGALDRKECVDVEQALAQCPEMTAELEKMRRSLDTLGLLEEPELEEPPLCLAARTCEFVEQKAESYSAETVILKAITASSIAAAEQVSSPSASASNARPKVTLSPVSRSEAGGPTLRKLDVIVASAIVLVASALSFPALYTSRFQANVDLCQHQLRQLGTALHEYSGLQQDGAFPHVPLSGPRSVAGVYAPTLVSNKLVPDSKNFFCPGSGDVAPEHQLIPTLDEIDAAPKSILTSLQNRMGGSFGYNMGYSRDANVLPPRNSRRAEYALLADAPNDLQPGRSSANHAGRGQNVLYEDGRVKFVKLANNTQQDSALDDPFHNRLGQVAAGLDINDAVLGRSPDHPVPALWQP
ncbi:hypothetical protein ETAA8_02180 [Anatilimnocola aggregata]|uniref:Uncharacterized protein n=1 Tax=Anatilimnocola aggregata TaxID=2528021 RepID=A0A517Y4N5_9BACT|nr:zf-HC2 domain-containing protein [Anatilimnocola aggregata]QDU25156.1 hypothetical protein ETAA8_02180 [Anatilimnocola aggregata]